MLPAGEFQPVSVARDGGDLGVAVGLGPISVSAAVDISVFTLVTCLVLKLGYTLESSGELQKNSRSLGPLKTDFLGLGFSIGMGSSQALI